MTAPARFYPIVPDIAWLECLAPLGIETVQLRLKDAAPAEVTRQIQAALRLAKAHRLQLIVNDYWREAIALGANYIHLGQEDLGTADLMAIRRAGLRVGISTHDEAELETALRAKPDYIALGPIYETRLKAMRFGPQGLDRIRQWKKAIGATPLVAIGGLTPERATLALGAGADSAAVITDFLTHPEPEARVREWVVWSRSAPR